MLPVAGCCRGFTAAQVLVLAAQSIAAHDPDDPAPHPRAELLLYQLDQWAQQHPAPTEDERDLWKELQHLPWCPVLLDPPDPALPWPHSVPARHQAGPLQAPAEQEALEGTAPAVPGELAAANEQQPEPPPVLRVAPKLAAPQDLAWLASAPLRMVAAGPASGSGKIGAELVQLLGWSQQQVLRPSVAVAQLMELGKMYPAGKVRNCKMTAGHHEV